MTKIYTVLVKFVSIYRCHHILNILARFSSAALGEDSPLREIWKNSFFLLSEQLFVLYIDIFFEMSRKVYNIYIVLEIKPDFSNITFESTIAYNRKILQHKKSAKIYFLTAQNLGVNARLMMGFVLAKRPANTSSNCCKF